ncbi:hypothetical protein HanIR_Chr03g0105301 [Helianthus annuus]|nr:hypothetical protein HanIR_Chr03g0105301 [Helianthus annuus]
MLVLIIGGYQEYPDEDQAKRKNRTHEKEASARCVVVTFKRRLNYIMLYYF